jgi:hypothetical protein
MNEKAEMDSAAQYREDAKTESPKSWVLAWVTSLSEVAV